jgi:hypothetical protein
MGLRKELPSTSSENRIVEKSVLTPKDVPSNFQEMRKSGIFRISTETPTGKLKRWYITMPIPDKPPAAILLGIRKRFIPRAITRQPVAIFKNEGISPTIDFILLDIKDFVLYGCYPRLAVFH